VSTFVQIDQNQFAQSVLQASQPVLVEFSAVWCGPCKRLEPEIEKLAAQWKDRVTIAKLDVDQSVDLAMRYQVMSVPTLILFVNGEPKQRVIGFQPLPKLVEKFEPFLSATR
jgi:thioredoxin 1